MGEGRLAFAQGLFRLCRIVGRGTLERRFAIRCRGIDLLGKAPDLVCRRLRLHRRLIGAVVLGKALCEGAIYAAT